MIRDLLPLFYVALDIATNAGLSATPMLPATIGLIVLYSSIRGNTELFKAGELLQ